MRCVLRLCLWLVFVVLLALTGVMWLVLDDQPRIQRSVEFTPANLERARRILEQNNPRTMQPGALHTLSIGQEDAELAANYLASRYGYGSVRLVLQSGVALLTASTPIAGLGQYVNIEATLKETPTLPRFERVHIGRMPIPGRMADWVLARIVARLHTPASHRAGGDVIKRVSFTDGQLAVIYAWHVDLVDRLRALVLSNDDRERLRLYYAQLGAVSRSFAAKRLSLTDVLPPIFRLAHERSRSGDAVMENRAAILVLAFYAHGTGLAAVVPAARSWPRPAARILTLHGRDDFPKHFMLSAALAASAGGPLSDAVGLYKEIDDARHGSGFSFNDLAADRAGTRFGEFATASKDTALRLQQRLSAGVRESDLMPETSDLPEFMSEAEFQRRFGGIGAPAYQHMIATIERRIAALQLYR